MENQPASLAVFFNLATGMSAINLPVGTPFDDAKEVNGDNNFADGDKDLGTRLLLDVVVNALSHTLTES